MQIELKAIQQQVGITFIYVTHDQEEALTMSDRMAVFNAGRIEQLGAPAEVYERPATRFVAGFVGTSNLLTGEAARADRSARTGPFTIRPEKIRPRRAGRRRSRDDEIGAAGHDPRRRLPRARTRATSSRSMRAPSWSSPSRTLRRPRPRRSRSRARLSAWSGSDSTNSPSRMGERSAEEEEDQT